MSFNNRKPGRPRDTWLPGERIPAPEATEENSEAAWELWQELSSGLDSQLTDTSDADTRPEPPRSDFVAFPGEGDTLPQPLAEAMEASIPRHLLTVEAVMTEARKNNRICPRISQWNDLFKLLTRGEPPPESLAPPVEASAWQMTSGLHKRARLRDQIVWASNHGGLRAAYAFLVNLPEDSWHHMGE
jgi:hypothetical protein